MVRLEMTRLEQSMAKEKAALLARLNDLDGGKAAAGAR